MDRNDLVSAVQRAIAHYDGEATIVQVAQYIWENDEAELRSSGDLFYTWQYEMRWAAQRLRDSGKLRLGKRDGRNTWQRIEA
jgi:hypothetical protein